MFYGKARHFIKNLVSKIRKALLKFTIMRKTLYTNHLYSFILITLNKFDMCEKKQTFGCAACFAGGFFFSSPIQPEKRILYPKKNMCFLFESCFN